MVHVTKIVARYAETDQMAIIHHAVYPVWYEQARGEMLKAAGISYREVEEHGFMIPLVGLECKYISPVHYEDEVSIETRVAKSTGASIKFEYTVKDSEGKIVNRGSTTHAWVRKSDFQIVNIKKAYPELYQIVQKTKEEDN